MASASERTLPIDGALLGEVLLRLRRDSRRSLRALDARQPGAAEVDVVVHLGRHGLDDDGPPLESAGLAVTAARCGSTVPGADEVRLTLEPTLPAGRGVGLTTPAISSIWPAPHSTSSPKSCFGTRRASVSPRVVEPRRISRRFAAHCTV